MSLLAFCTSLFTACVSYVASRASPSHFSHLSQLHLVCLLVSSSSSFTCFFNVCQSLLELLSVSFNLIICFLYFIHLLLACFTCFYHCFRLLLASLSCF
jgi:hypothetical protein